MCEINEANAIGGPWVASDGKCEESADGMSYVGCVESPARLCTS